LLVIQSFLQNNGTVSRRPLGGLKQTSLTMALLQCLLTTAFLACKSRPLDWLIPGDVSPFIGPSSDFSILIALSQRYNDVGRFQGRRIVETCIVAHGCPSHLMIAAPYLTFSLCCCFTYISAKHSPGEHFLPPTTSRS